MERIEFNNNNADDILAAKILTRIEQILIEKKKKIIDTARICTNDPSVGDDSVRLISGNRIETFVFSGEKNSPV